MCILKDCPTEQKSIGEVILRQQRDFKSFCQWNIINFLLKKQPFIIEHGRRPKL